MVAMKRSPCILALIVVLPLVPCAEASIQVFEVPLSGAQEAPGPGDPDGTGLATLMFDDVALSVTWDITVSDIDLPITLDHIHFAPAGVSGPVAIDFMGMLVGGPVFDPDVAALLSDPTQYYVNVHNMDFPAGAIRGQLPAAPTRTINGRVPEPTAFTVWCTLGLAVTGFWWRRKL
jgi:hypothetical protein